MIKQLEKYSIGVGDRFGHQGAAQLRAIIKANKLGLRISPVWNKSNREHLYIQSQPDDVREEADSVVKQLGFDGKYFVDADHINLSTVAPFVHSSDFFTFDVTDGIGKPTTENEVNAFVNSCAKYQGMLLIPGIEKPYSVSHELLTAIASNFLTAIQQAADIYNFLVEKKGKGSFVSEVSMDEVSTPQTPVELFFILKMLAEKGVPVQTIAPRFVGRFNKGVDYVGDLVQFEKEFEEAILVIDFAIKEFNLPQELKLSIHSGSDKFSIYPIMGKIIRKYNKGLHVKTAGTTWIEEVIGLSIAGGKALDFVKQLYFEAYNRQDELCAPYADVIDIKNSELPSVEEVSAWPGEKFANVLRHDQSHADFNPGFRQLIHVAYKIAAEKKLQFTSLLKEFELIIAACVEENIYERHLKRLFF
jgi:hypothetical protein